MTSNSLLKSSLLKNSVLNVFGVILPAATAIPALGYMARELSLSMFGLIMLIWALVGYAGIFDAGVAKAVVREISCSTSISDKNIIMGTAVSIVGVTGMLATGIVFISSRHIVDFINISPAEIGVAERSINIAALCMPLFLISLVLQAYLEGIEDFVVFNLYRSFSGVILYAMPALGLFIYNDFLYVVIGLLLARFASLIMCFSIVHKRISVVKWSFSKLVLIRLFRFGGWLTVTNIISPFMVYMDRFIISSILGPKAVAVYSAPAELVSRMSILPVAIGRAVFPRLSALYGGNKSAASELKQAYLYSIILTAPISLFVIIFSPYIIELWLGNAFSKQAEIILRVLILGFLFNAIALIPYNELQSKGKSYLTAKIHLLEVLPYLGLLILCTKYYGVIGAAFVWTFRMAVDMVLMVYSSRKFRTVD